MAQLVLRPRLIQFTQIQVTLLQIRHLVTRIRFFTPHSDLLISEISSEFSLSLSLYLSNLDRTKNWIGQNQGDNPDSSDFMSFVFVTTILY